MKLCESNMKIRFIKFKDGNEIKLCHARIESETDSTIEFRTAAAFELISKKKEDILEITENVSMNQDEINVLYHGNIINIGKEESK